MVPGSLVGLSHSYHLKDFSARLHAPSEEA